MTEKLRNTGAMLVDIYEDNLHELPIVRSIYQEINSNPTKEFPSIGKPDQQMLIYVALMYDKNSPIRKETIVNRKTIALQQAGVNNNTTIENWTSLNNKRLIMMIHYYLRHQNDKAWAALCTIEEFFWELENQLLTSIGNKSDDILKELGLKSKLRDEFAKTIEEITRYQDIVFGDNKEKIDEIINFYPEDFVELLEQKQKERL